MAAGKVGRGRAAVAQTFAPKVAASAETRDWRAAWWLQAAAVRPAHRRLPLRALVVGCPPRRRVAGPLVTRLFPAAREHSGAVAISPYWALAAPLVVLLAGPTSPTAAKAPLGPQTVPLTGVWLAKQPPKPRRLHRLLRQGLRQRQSQRAHKRQQGQVEVLRVRSVLSALPLLVVPLPRNLLNLLLLVLVLNLLVLNLVLQVALLAQMTPAVVLYQLELLNLLLLVLVLLLLLVLVLNLLVLNLVLQVALLAQMTTAVVPAEQKCGQPGLFPQIAFWSRLASVADV